MQTIEQLLARRKHVALELTNVLLETVPGIDSEDNALRETLTTTRQKFDVMGVESFTNDLTFVDSLRTPLECVRATDVSHTRT